MKYTFDQIVQRFQFYVKEYNKGGARGYNRRLKGACIGIIEDLSGSTEARYAIFEALTGEKSSKTMAEAHWYAMCKLVDPHKPGSESPWQGRDNLSEIIQVLLANVSVQAPLPLLGPASDVDWDEVIAKVAKEGV